MMSQPKCLGNVMVRFLSEVSHWRKLFPVFNHPRPHPKKLDEIYIEIPGEMKYGRRLLRNVS